METSTPFYSQHSQKIFSLVVQDRFAAKHKYIFREIVGLTRLRVTRVMVCVQQNLLDCLCVKSIPNSHMHSGQVNVRVHEKVLVLFQESLKATTIFLQLCHFLLDVFQEVRV